METSTMRSTKDLINIVHDHCLKQSVEKLYDKAPKLEMQFENEEDAYDFYNEYARRIGFGIRKEYRNFSKKDGMLTSRRFSCHKEGERSANKRDHLTKQARAETRTNCQARLTICLDRKVGKYKVVDFVVEHNHPLQPSSYVHIARSQRRKIESQAAEIETVNECGLSLRDFNEFTVRKVGGIDNLGFVKVDQKNYLRAKRNHTFRFGEISSLLKYFKGQARKDQMDREEQITNIFWADAEMINDYRYFGDVLLLNTTYRNNKDYRPLGVFFGYNNHREMVIFGAALLYDETIPSFEWLFETFFEAMGGKRPKTIFTDQDAAMARAIPSVMPETFHGLCTWHIRENALRHENHLYHDNSEFCQNFEACIDVYEKEEGFLCAWDGLLVQHDVSSNSWLHTIFQVKEKWAWAYVNKAFTAGIRSTQLNKSLNSDLKSHLKSDLSLVDFFIHFEMVVNSKRYNEAKAEYESIHKLPRLKMKKVPMLVQAGNLYTPKIFEEFQDDYEDYLGAYIKDHKEEGSMNAYTIANINETKERTVASNVIDKTVSCDCRKFETHGILCSHALKVLDVMNVKLLPDHYVIKRWTRDARFGRRDDLNGQHKELDSITHFTERYTELCPQIGNLVSRSCETNETYNFLSKVCEESTKMVEQMLAKRSTPSGEIERNVPTADYSGVKRIKRSIAVTK